MKLKDIIILPILFFSILSWNNAYAQIKAVNDKGEKIILYPDGSWEYDKEEVEEKGKKAKSDTKKVKSEAPIKKTYTREEMLEARQDVTERFRRAKMAKEAYKDKQSQYSTELMEYTEEFELAQENNELTPSEESTYKARIKILKRQLSDAKKGFKQSGKDEKTYQKMLTYTGEKLMLSYQQILGKENKKEKIKTTKPQSPSSDQDPVVKNVDKPKKNNIPSKKDEYDKQVDEIRKKKEEARIAKIEMAKGRLEKLEKKYTLYPTVDQKSKNCEMAFDEVDVFSGNRKRATKRSLFFSQVDEEYESHMKGKGYLVCTGFVSELKGKDYLLVLELEVQSKSGRDEYGGLRVGGDLVLMLIDGTKVTLENTQSDDGSIDIAKKTTTFKGYFPLDKKQMKMLMDNEVTKARLVWGGGFEDYDIYEMDFFRDHLTCLKETK